MENLKITNFTIDTLEEAKFVKPVRINYTQNGKDKTWEAVQTYASVAVLLYHTTKNAFLLVKQFRPPVYMSDPNYEYTYELCAGLMDKNKPIKNIVQEEILEECGYEVDVNSIEKIASFFTNVGINGSKQSLYYASIDDSMKVSEGGGINDEEIVLEYLPLKDAKPFMFDESKAKTPGLMFSFYWFFENHKELLN